MSNKVSTKAPSGMRDFLAPALWRRRYVVRVIQDVYERYGFLPLETPCIENLSTLLGKYGEEGDQLLYRLLHRRDALTRVLEQEVITESALADLGLRYDLTVPLARVVAQYSNELPRFYRRYQIQPVWRADRPGRGRFREFYQCDVDVTGTKSALAEVEVASAVAEVLQRLGFETFKIHYNHRVLLREIIRATGIDDAHEESALVAVDKLSKIGVEGVSAELVARGIEASAANRLLSVLGRNDHDDDEVLAERLQHEWPSEASKAAIDNLLTIRRLAQGTPLARHLKFDPTLVRGLGYYTGAIFEITVPELAGSLGGGGRYDGLIGMFGKQEIPAVGFSLGLERILLVMEERNMYPESVLSRGIDVMVCWISPGVDEAQALSLTHRLRAQGLLVEIYPEANAKLSKQIQYADSVGVKANVAAIVGEAELADDSITLKHLGTAEQVQVKINEVKDFVAKHARL